MTSKLIRKEVKQLYLLHFHGRPRLCSNFRISDWGNYDPKKGIGYSISIWKAHWQEEWGVLILDKEW